jgi:spermidine/putrescine transport system permease protein
MKRKAPLSARIASAPYILWMIIFIVFPLILVAYYAFTDKNGNFTMSNITEISRYSDTFVRSIWFALIATLICLVIAYPLAYIMSKTTGNAQRTLMMIVMLPMWMNFLLRTYSWMLILDDTGILNTLFMHIGLGQAKMINTSGAVILGMVYNYLPYMILPIYSVMTKLDKRLFEACEDLGGNSVTVFSKVVMPLSVPGVISGITMVFVPSVSTFYISQKLGGGKFPLIGDVIEMQFQTAYNYNLGAAISLVLMVLILLCLFVMEKYAGDDGEEIVA